MASIIFKLHSSKMGRAVSKHVILRVCIPVDFNKIQTFLNEYKKTLSDTVIFFNLSELP